VSRDFIIADAFLLATQGVLVALPAAGIPGRLVRFTSRGWALIAPLSIAVVVAAIALFPQVADALTWVALILVPIGAMLALGWAMHGAQPASAIVAALLFAYCWAQVGTLTGDAAAAALTALSTVTVGRLLAGLVPGLWLKAGIVAMAIIDSILVFGNQLQGPNATLNAAIPVPGAPQLQYLDLHYASMGYGDVFVAGLLGGILAAEGRRQVLPGLLVFVLAALWDLLFLHFNTLPATVPVAVAVVLLELKR
jgi:hypothetical protein